LSFTLTLTGDERIDDIKALLRDRFQITNVTLSIGDRTFLDSDNFCEFFDPNLLVECFTSKLLSFNINMKYKMSWLFPDGTTGLDLRRVLSDHLQWRADEIELSFGSHLIGNNEEIDFSRYSSQILVSLHPKMTSVQFRSLGGGNPIALSLRMSDCRIASVRSKIADRLGVTASNTALVFACEFLSDDQTLSSLCLTSHSVIRYHFL
jgi:hypothetical protein